MSRTYRALVPGVVLGGILLGSLAHAATTYYVAPSPLGSDARACSIAQTIDTPKQTISNAIGCLAPGDTLLIRGGTYPEEVRLPPGGTSWSDAVTIAAYPNETVLLQPSGTEYAWLYALSTSRYSILDGLHIDATHIATGTVIRVTQTDHIRIQNCEIYSTNQRDAQGILADGTGHEFLNNHIHHLANSHFVHGIYLSGDHALIQGNHIHHVNGYGIHIFNGSNGIDAHHNRVIGNRVHDTGHAPDSAAQTAILLSSGVGNIAINNVVYNNHRGIEVAYGGHQAVVSHNTIYNNHGAGGFGIGLSAIGAVVRNNLAYGNDQDYSDTGSDTTVEHNLFGTDPRFVNPCAGDFHLQAGSPAIDAGVVLAEVPTDAESLARPQGLRPDQGAYEFGGAAAALPPGNVQFISQ